MKGFFRRDFYLMIGALKFQLGLVVLMAVLALTRLGNADTMVSLLSIYAFVFLVAGVVGLVQSDEQNGWMAYAAAVPNGRRDQVAARYLLTVTCCLSAAVLTGMVSFATGGRESLLLTLGLTGAWLLYTALALPLTYRFGSKSRLVILLVMAVCAALIGGAGAVGVISDAKGSLAFAGLRWVTPALILVGLAALAVSYVISVRIMAKKEL